MENNKTFRDLLNTLVEQNKTSSMLQLLQVKYERETSGEDADKREEQLDHVSKLLASIENSLTGFKVKFDFQPVVSALVNQTDILQKLLEEQTLTRKLTEGSIEYSKEGAQYRNLSGRELESKVTGKNIPKGGFVDFETAVDRLTGQPKRVRESLQNQLNLRPIDTAKKIVDTAAPALRVAKSIPNIRGERSNRDFSSKNQITRLGNPIDLTNAIGARLLGAFDFLTGSQTYKRWKNKYEDKMARKAMPTSIASPGPSPSIDKATAVPEVQPKKVSPLSDNIETPEEAQVKAQKQELNVSRDTKSILEEQLKELRTIREKITSRPSTDVIKKPTAAPLEPVQSQQAPSGSIIPDWIGDVFKPKNAPVTPGQVKPSLGSRALQFLTGAGGKTLGAAAAVGLGAYEGYSEYTAAEDSKQAQLAEIQQRLDQGIITPAQAAEERKAIENTATVKKAGAVGSGVGITGGAIAGGVAGAKLGATLGTFVGGPAGTAVGGGIGALTGGAIGAFSGSKAGRYIAEQTAENRKQIAKWFVEKKSQASKALEIAQNKAQATGQLIAERTSNMINESRAAIGAVIGAPASVVPVAAVSRGRDILNETVENKDLTREITTKSQIVAPPIVTSSVNNINTNTLTPIKTGVRDSDCGSYLERYLTRVSSFI